MMARVRYLKTLKCWIEYIKYVKKKHPKLEFKKTYYGN